MYTPTERGQAAAGSEQQRRRRRGANGKRLPSEINSQGQRGSVHAGPPNVGIVQHGRTKSASSVQAEHSHAREASRRQGQQRPQFVCPPFPNPIRGLAVGDSIQQLLYSTLARRVPVPTRRRCSLPPRLRAIIRTGGRPA